MSRIEKNHKIATITSVIALVAFLGVAGFATISVTSIASIVEGKILANKDGVPEAWDTYTNHDSIEASTDAQINNGYVEYTTSVKNTDSDTLSLTHVSSYIEEEGTRGGFMPLAEDTLEYTYDPSNDKSWTPVKISAPSNDEDGYKLDSAIYVGEEGSSTDTIYLRYNLSPSKEGAVTDKVTVVTENSLGDTAITVSSSELDYEKPELAASTETTSSTDKDSDSAYAKPLGVSSKSPSTSVVNASTLGAISISEETVTPSIIVMFIALGIFAASLIAYLIIHSKSDKKSRSRR